MLTLAWNGNMSENVRAAGFRLDRSNEDLLTAAFSVYARYTLYGGPALRDALQAYHTEILRRMAAPATPQPEGPGPRGFEKVTRLRPGTHPSQAATPQPEEGGTYEVTGDLRFAADTPVAAKWTQADPPAQGGYHIKVDRQGERLTVSIKEDDGEWIRLVPDE